jgi:chemotaxis regulatin CheY-phosphate phosphatase CheZ
MTSDNLQVKIHREISELTESIANLVDNFRKLKRPLVESQEKVPQATNQLDKIAQQTEAATNQMLDRIEHITQREEEVIAGIQEMKSKAQSGDNQGVCTLADALSTKANDNLNDAFMIMDSLQFQDITAQQMDHAASLLEELEGKLHQVLKTVAGPEAANELAQAPQARKVRAYDPHADLFEKKTNQEDIDSLFKSHQK